MPVRTSASPPTRPERQRMSTFAPASPPVEPREAAHGQFVGKPNADPEAAETALPASGPHADDRL